MSEGTDLGSLSIEEEAKELKVLRGKRDVQKQLFDVADADYKQAVDRLYQRMEAGSIDGIKVDGVNFVPSETVYANVQDRDSFVKWAEENDDQLVENRERKALLNQLVRERLDNGEVLPEGVGFYVRETIALRNS